MNDLELATLLEQEILLNQGITAACGCSKRAFCFFPHTTWYYVPICLHDDVSGLQALTPDITIRRFHWWYDLRRGCMVQAFEFEHVWGRADSTTGFVVAYADKRIFFIASNGQVRQIHPIPNEGGWL